MRVCMSIPVHLFVFSVCFPGSIAPLFALRLILLNPLVLVSIMYSIAPHSLSTIVKKFEEPRVLEIIDKISRNLLEGADDLRDIYATGIKTIISAVPKVLYRYGRVNWWTSDISV